MAAFDFADEKKEPWNIAELKGDIKEAILKSNQFTGETKQFAHEIRTVAEEAYRTPITMSTYLRLAMHDQREKLPKGTVIGDGPMNRFNGYLDGFVGAYNRYVHLALRRGTLNLPSFQI